MRFFNALARLFGPANQRNRRATVAMMTALSMPIFVGSTGLTVDIGLWFAQKTALQAATDAGAMKAARDLAENAATPNATLQADAISEANAASSNQFNLNTSDLSITLLSDNKTQTDNRKVQVSAFVPGLGFFGNFAKIVNIPPSIIRATSVAGISYSLISNQATCYAFDSYTYLYSTGFGTIDTSHSAGIDPFKCGTPPAPPAAYDAYCGGGILNCSLDLLGLGNKLLPMAFQIKPNGTPGGLAVPLSSVVGTLSNLLLGTGYGTGAGPTVFGQGSASCPGNVCTIPAGVYNGGLVIGPGVSINFTKSGGSDYFLIENGNLVISTQDALAPSNDSNAVFFLGGATPGAYVAETQEQFNLAALSSGALQFTSAATFSSSSLLGAQTSAPLSSMAYAQSQATSNGLLSLLGLPGGNLLGTNLESVTSECPQAVSTCTTPVNQAAIFQWSLLPSLNSVLSTLTSAVPNLPVTSLLISSGETSTTTIHSGITVANGVPTDWEQDEVATSSLNNTPSPVQSVVNLVNGLLNLLGNLFGAPNTTTLVSNVINDITGSATTLNPQTSASGVFAGQTSNGAPTCASATPVFNASIPSTYGPVFNNLLDTSSSPNGQSVAISTTDTIAICGTSQIANLQPISPGQVIVASTAGGASTIALQQ
jgi:hypothetical protein